MMSRTYIICFVLGFGVLLTPAVSRAQDQPTAGKQKSTATTQKIAQTHNDGDRIFAQNCSRCHTAPEGFSPRISGTIVRHMRLRAQLSQHDEEELLRFFNP